MITNSRILVLLAATTLFPLASASAQIQIVAIEDEPVPGVPGEFFSSFGTPAIDDVGVVYFKARWGVAYEDGGIMWNQNDSVSILLQEGINVAGLPFTLGRFNDVVVSPSGLNAGVAGVVSVRSGGQTTDAIVMIRPGGGHANSF